MSPQVTVIMSAYNSSDTIERAISSILRQSFSELELIILNDGSTDDTEEKILAFLDKRIKYFALDHSGLTKSLNFGLSKARTNYIFRHDSDDWSEPERFATQMAILIENVELGLVASWHNVVDPNGEYLGCKRIPTDDASLKRMLRWRNSFCHGSVVMRRSAIDRVGNYNESLLYSQDYDLWVRFAEAGVAFASVPEPLYNYSISPDSIAKGWHKLANLEDIRHNALLPETKRNYSISAIPMTGIRRTNSLWCYAVGSLALEDGRRGWAIKHFAKSLMKYPLQWRALVKMITAILPTPVKDMIFGGAKIWKELSRDDHSKNS